MNNYYKFEKLLIDGIVLSRPNRFIMKVLVNNSILDCYCPVTGRIGSIKFNRNIPCLISESKEKKRKLKWTVEAISVPSFNKKEMRWIGINQTKTNEYINFFISNGMLSKIVRKPKEIRREVRIGKSRIDFLLDKDHLLEVKTFLLLLPGESSLNMKFNSYAKFIQQYRDLIVFKEKKHKCTIVFCFIYDSPLLASPAFSYYTAYMKSYVQKALGKGIKHWQVNMKIHKNKIELIKYAELS